MAVMVLLLLFSVAITAMLALTPHPVTLSTTEVDSLSSAPVPKKMNSFTGTNATSEKKLESLAGANVLSISQVVTTTSTSGGPQPGDQTGVDIQPLEIIATEQLAYPEPIEGPVEGPAYPQPQFQPTISDILPFSTAPSDESSRPIESIGGNFDNPQTAKEDTNQEASSTVFLWLGFIVAFMIFITGVYGSIVLFTRQRSSGG